MTSWNRSRCRVRNRLSGIDPLESAKAGDLDGKAGSSSRAGEVLDGKFELVHKLGQGRMGEVYEARHCVLGRRVAIKLLHPELTRSPRMLARFEREGRAGARLESDHVVSVLDCGRTKGGEPYLVMEALRGRDLRRLLRAEAPLAAPRAVKLMIDLCRGLHRAHAQGLVHRDLKPENVFVVQCDDGRELAKILDFGIVLDEGTSMTEVGTLMGTLRYMAPEQVNGTRCVDARSDIYAVGVLLYECLTGRVPHSGSTYEEIMFHVLNGSPPPLSTLRPGLPNGLERVVERAMAKQAGLRHQDCSALVEDLIPFAGEAIARLDSPHLVLAEHSGAFSAPADDRRETRCESLPCAAGSPEPSRWRLVPAVIPFLLGAASALLAVHRARSS